MKLLAEIYFQGNGYGRVLTRVEPTGLNRQGDDMIRLESLSLAHLAQLFVDVRGETQPHLPPYCEANLARWIARLWIWHEGMDK